MEYKIIKVKFSVCEENRFYRTFAVRHDLNLRNFGCAILSAFLSSGKKDYFFADGVIRYLPKHLIRDYFKEDKLISDYTLEVLPNEFEFYYGIDEYKFDCVLLIFGHQN